LAHWFEGQGAVRSAVRIDRRKSVLSRTSSGELVGFHQISNSGSDDNSIKRTVSDPDYLEVEDAKPSLLAVGARSTFAERGQSTVRFGGNPDGFGF
jgi:hypothetical protein